jgi:hypothetical protein
VSDPQPQSPAPAPVCVECKDPEAIVTARSSTTPEPRCRRCSYAERGRRRSRPAPGRSLAELYPDVAAQWHPTLNGALTPRDVAYASNKPVWWSCGEPGHAPWQASPGDRTGGRGCRRCGRDRTSAAQKTPKPGHELDVRDPVVAADWHPTRNGALTPHDVSYGSRVDRWWLCSTCGHEWQANPGNRCVGWRTGCPRCSMWGTSAQEIRLRHELAAAGCPVEHPSQPIAVPGRRPVNADIVCPAWRLAIEFDGYQFHRRPTSRQRDVAQTRALSAAGWTVLRVREALPPLTPHDVTVPLHAGELATAQAVVAQLLALGFTARRAPRYLAATQPWDRAGADTAIYLTRTRSIASELPQLAAEWHPTRNGTVQPHQIHPGDNDRWWWLCATCGHEWRASPTTRRSGCGCVRCGHVRTAAARARPRPGESLAERYPEFVDEWHPTANGHLTPAQFKPASAHRAWWQCRSCAHAWQTRIAHRTTSHSGCPRCPRPRAARP